MDRIGQTRVILTTTAITAAGSTGLILLAHGGATVAALCAVAAFAGLGTVPTGTAMRTLWSDLVPQSDLRQAAFALDAVAIDVAFIVGPLIAAAVIAVASPTASLSVCIACRYWGPLCSPRHAHRGPGAVRRPSTADWTVASARPSGC